VTLSSKNEFMYKGADGARQLLMFDGLACGVKELVAMLGLDPSKYASHSHSAAWGCVWGPCVGFDPTPGAVLHADSG
jgi:hypothetical protein